MCNSNIQCAHTMHIFDNNQYNEMDEHFSSEKNYNNNGSTSLYKLLSNYVAYDINMLWLWHQYVVLITSICCAYDINMLWLLHQYVVLLLSTATIWRHPSYIYPLECWLSKLITLQIPVDKISLVDLTCRPGQQFSFYCQTMDCLYPQKCSFNGSISHSFMVEENDIEIYIIHEFYNTVDALNTQAMRFLLRRHTNIFYPQLKTLKALSSFCNEWKNYNVAWPIPDPAWLLN